MHIAEARAVVEVLRLPVQVAEGLRREARLLSVHFSTRIEGNPLDLDEVKKLLQQRRRYAESRAEQEVRNYWAALDFLERCSSRRLPVTEMMIKRLHRIIEVRGPGRRGKLSAYRDDQNVVRDSATGSISYLPPQASDVPRLMAELVAWVNGDEALHLAVPIRAAIAAYQLLTIHPFWDGNGRTARALATYILNLGGYGLNGYYSLEEYYARDLAGYYDHLQMGLPHNYYDGRCNPDLTPWIAFFLRGMREVFDEVRFRTVRLHQETVGSIDPCWSRLGIRERRLAAWFQEHGPRVTPVEVAALFGVSTRTARNWLKVWVADGFLTPASGRERVRAYILAPEFQATPISGAIKEG